MSNITNINDESILKQIERNLMDFSSDVKVQNVGKVEKNTDGVITSTGLTQAGIGEEVEFENGVMGMILGLDEDYASIIVLGEGNSISEGSTVKRTGRILSINVHDSILGRVINPIGLPLDGKPEIKKGTAMPLEKLAAGVIERESVDTPLKTGIKAIDSMIPIGRGQRELIIGDRGLGKTAIAIDTIINQKHHAKDQKPVICIYVAIGQKQSTVAQVINVLKENDALPYSIVIAASASEPVALQYLAPFAGVAIAEYFCAQGRDVLIVYDDLTKHAWAYRQLSLVLRRPAGREAYPGDIFYLHSRLLERAVKLSKKNGGGSITALPIIETQAGDISAYIPTNVISITDGQIFVESDLFNNGIRPAINAGYSVSRVGGAAQTSAMKSVIGMLRIAQAQYRELAAFAQFGSELDADTRSQLEKGKRTVEVLKQAQYHPLSEPLQIMSIWAVTHGYTDDIPAEDVLRFEHDYIEYLQRKGKKLLDELATGKKPSKETQELMQNVTEDFKKTFSA